MRKITLYGAILMAFIIGGCDSVDVHYNPSTNATIPDSIKQELVENAETYYNFFGIHRVLQITDSFAKPVTTPTIKDGEMIEGSLLALAWGHSSEIVINNYFFKSKNCTRIAASGVFAHELFHTLNSGIPTPFPGSPGDANVEFLGLIYSATSPEGKHVQFDELEEAGAEVCGEIVFGDKYPYSNYYRSMTALMEAFLDSGYVTAPELVAAAKTNDVPMIVGKMLNKNRDDVSNDDIGAVIDIFEKAHNADPAASSFEDIKEYFYAIKNVRPSKQPVVIETE